ncbi:hypothetical protein COCSUDRAFT_32160 [Coccomyxa subellipsoidea C-169]|uniref:Uncharacterized protein n=1 Tax=Coccomyxa subellipsoidea (strain C-169) TaxID=574566 RepID=I0Z6Z2_COCSC|nr:hypothetical protein COCSUDRAFT_32160 [Coccomyxa subellipsoidea C-169]EIE26411.1 hypothetical protein COCSUDRAFT_32160 [Coccomyxa subellipsoidea C-169]|eukprot:XP_005650955.1 hypothetical protein COCSUDRAFT_32160 [Coccomyxa subellipsoidea C-169]
MPTHGSYLSPIYRASQWAHTPVSIMKHTWQVYSTQPNYSAAGQIGVPRTES